MSIKRYVLKNLNIDHLTQLPNRRAFIKKLNKEIDIAKNNQTKFFIISFNLDHFKEINHNLGIQWGDQLIFKIRDRILEYLEDKKSLFRIQGDEFAVILSNTCNIEECEKKINDIMDLFKKPFIINSHELYIKISIGAAAYPDDGEDTDSLLKHLDITLTTVKSQGGNHYQFYSKDMNANGYKQFILRNDLEKAIQEEQFIVYYQPLVEIDTNKIISVEALIRWNHPKFGMVFPSDFISIAEASKLIIPLGEWILRAVCKDYIRWKQLGFLEIKIAVNFSGVQLQQIDLVESIKAILDEYGLNPSFLIVEATESVLLQNTEKVVKDFEQLKTMGIKVAIDDFGMGYSSLYYLKHLKSDIIKIDREFIKDLNTDLICSHIVRNIVSLSKDLKLSLVAEGIENKEQLNCLREMNCKFGQGYLYSRPILVKELEAVLKMGICIPAV